MAQVALSPADWRQPNLLILVGLILRAPRPPGEQVALA